MFRFALIMFLLFFYLIFLSPIMLILLIIRKFSEESAAKIGQAMVAFAFRIMLFIAGAKVEVRGLENIPKENGVLFISNHRSYFDILVGYAYTPKLLGFIAKKEMEKFFLLKQWMDIVNCLFLDREDIKKGLQTILSAIEKVKRGTSIWICPEGTRNKSAAVLDLMEFKEGSFKIAEKGKVPIIPVGISGTGELFERQFPRIVPTKIVLHYGTPIYINELDKENRKKIGSYTRDIIIDILKKDM